MILHPLKYVLGHYGELAAPVDQEVLAHIMRLPRTRELQHWELPQRGLEELRQEYGAGLSDEDFLLRVLSSNQDAVDEVLAAGPARYNYPRGDKPVLAQVCDLMQRQDVASVHIQKGDFSLTLR